MKTILILIATVSIVMAQDYHAGGYNILDPYQSNGRPLLDPNFVPVGADPDQEWHDRHPAQPPEIHCYTVRTANGSYLECE